MADAGRAISSIGSLFENKEVKYYNRRRDIECSDHVVALYTSSNALEEWALYSWPKKKKIYIYIERERDFARAAVSEILDAFQTSSHCFDRW